MRACTCFISICCFAAVVAVLLLLLWLALKVGSSMLRQPLVLHLARTHGVASLMAARGVSCDQAIVGSLLLMFRSRQQSRAATACCLLLPGLSWRVCRLWWVCNGCSAGVLSLSTQRRQRRQREKERVAGHVVVFFFNFCCSCCTFFTCANVCIYFNAFVYVLEM